MESVQELRVRIEKLSTEIDLQKELLKKLERDKSLIQCQLNTILDPVARLPLEISSEIFLQSLPHHPVPGAHHVPMLLLNICKSWSTIALSTPALWAAIHIIFPRARGFKHLLPIWLHRACNSPLSISLEYEGDIDKTVVDIIWRHGRQLEHLEINTVGDEEDCLDLWGEIAPDPLPLLVTLKMRRTQVPTSQILQLLLLAPNLVECIFDNIFFISESHHDDHPIAEPLTLPALRRLRFVSCGGILKFFSAPQLEAFSTSEDVVRLFSFLERSSPPLQELDLGYGMESGALARCLRLVPTLTRLAIRWPDSLHTAELFAAFAESSLSPVVPALHSLTMQLTGSYITESFWQTLLRTVIARRSRIRILHLELNRGLELVRTEPVWPSADILAAFRDLEVDGMDIYIGISEHASSLPWNLMSR